MVDKAAARAKAIHDARQAGILGLLEGSDVFASITKGSTFGAEVGKALKGTKVYHPDDAPKGFGEAPTGFFVDEKKNKNGEVLNGKSRKPAKSKKQMAIAKAKQSGILPHLSKNSFDKITGSDALASFKAMKKSDFNQPYSGDGYSGGFGMGVSDFGSGGGTIPAGDYSTLTAIEKGRPHKSKKKIDSTKHAHKNDHVKPHKHKHHHEKGHNKVAKHPKKHGAHVAARDPLGAGYDLHPRKPHPIKVKLNKPKVVKTVKVEKKLDGPAISWMPVSAYDTFASMAPDGFLYIHNTKS